MLLLGALAAAVGCSGTRPAESVLPTDSSIVVDTSGDSSSTDGTGPVSLRLVLVAGGLESPVYLTSPADDARLFVVELAGRIRVIRDGRLLDAPFLDLRGNVSTGDERGMLSMAFHPSYASNGFFYTYYTDRDGDIRVERYTVSSNPDIADAASVHRILTIEHSRFSNHNGGLVRFGPDGMLYLGVGDGGGAGDPDGRAQNRADILGKVLRIDVNSGDPYGIPSGNPFPERGEVWNYGLRNPWRFAFDQGLLYIADVGQDEYEEISVVPASKPGFNLGWNIMEGRHCSGGGESCNQAGLTAPVIEYTHADGCSITGGAVYRGAIREIRGHYFYSDYCAGWLKSFRYVNGQATDQRTWNVENVGLIPSFGEDAARELYLLAASGSIYRIQKQ